MRRVLPSGLFLCAALAPLGAAGASLSLDAMPKIVQTYVWDLHRACSQLGGRPGDVMQAIETADLDGDGAADVIFDEARFPCRDVRARVVCPEIGCSTFVALSDHGRWRLALDVVGGYCLDRTSAPPKFMTVQQNFTAGGAHATLNVRYVFRRGMAFQEGRGKC
jgi:hypothetical protein